MTDSPSSPLTASIIIATRNRASQLRRLLTSISHLTYEQLEVVVVVGPSTDNTLDVVDEFRDRMKIVPSPEANMCLSRNIGLAAAAGDIAIFIDDDGIPATRSWVDALIEPFLHNDRIAATGGPVFYQDSDAYQFRNGAVSEYGEHVFTADSAEKVECPRGWYRRAMGTNMAFRRDRLVAMGGFDERIVYYGDECDVIVRLAQAGYDFAFVEQASVRHYPAPSVHRNMIDRTFTVTHDDTYFCLRNASDSWPVKLFTTLRKAPKKHYIEDVKSARRQGRVTFTDYRRFLDMWIRGMAKAVREAIFTSRKLMTAPVSTPAFLPVTRPAPSTRLSILLTARQLACDGPVEGPARYTYDLAHGLHALGHEIHLIGESPSVRREHALGFTVHGVAATQITRHLFPKHGILDGNLAYALAVADRIRELRKSGMRLDVAHCTNWNFEGLGLILDRHLPVTMMLVTSLLEVINYERWDHNDDLDAGVCLDRAQIHAAAALCAPTNGLVRAYVENGLLTEELATQVARTNLGIVPRPIAAARRAERPAARSPKRLLFVGTHVRRKGLDDLLAVLPDLLERHHDWHCDIAGDDTRIVDDGRTLKEQFAREYSNEHWYPRVKFHGRVDEARLWELYAAAGVYVVPSRFESFGLTYLEAMQFGVPAVATTGGGIPEVIRDGVTGKLVPVGDREALAETLEALMSSNLLRKQLGCAAEADVHARWTHLHMAQRLLPVYEAAIETHRAQPRAADRTAAPQPIRGDDVLDLMATVGTPADLLGRLRESITFQSTTAERQMMVEAASGRLPSAPLYVAAVELCLTRGDAERALRLIADAHAHAPSLEPDTSEELAELHEIAYRLAAVDSTQQEFEIPSAERTRPVGSAGPRLDHALTLVREGRIALAMARLSVIEEDETRPQNERLHARYHLGSALKRCGFAREAERRLRELTSASGFGTLPADVRAATWFHAAELAMQAGRLADADAGFVRCLELNPRHGRAAVLRRELESTLVPSGSQR